MPDPDRLAVAARGLFPPGVAVMAADPQAPPPPLLTGENPGRVLDKRFREFAAGRAAARAAMAALGLPALPLAMAADRAPDWPPGVVGSISHSATACLAVVTTTDRHVGLGVDLEPEGQLDPDLWETVLTPQERMDLPQERAGQQALLIFAAKEAAYKAQYAVTKTLIDFQALQVRVGPTHFTAEWQIDLGPFRKGTVMEGRHVLAEGHILTAMAL